MMVKIKGITPNGIDKIRNILGKWVDERPQHVLLIKVILIRVPTSTYLDSLGATYTLTGLTQLQ